MSTRVNAQSLDLTCAMAKVSVFDRATLRLTVKLLQPSTGFAWKAVHWLRKGYSFEEAPDGETIVDLAFGAMRRQTVTYGGTAAWRGFTAVVLAPQQ